MATFITGTKLLVKKPSKIDSYKNLRNKTVVVTQGTTDGRVIKALSDKDSACGITSGHRNVCTSSGMLRKNST